MLVTILVLLSLSFFVNILLGIVVVRSRETADIEFEKLRAQVKRLTKELLVRLPPRPYGVEFQEPPSQMTIGPYDSRIPG
jgi:hypothetical protein